MPSKSRTQLLCVSDLFHNGITLEDALNGVDEAAGPSAKSAPAPKPKSKNHSIPGRPKLPRGQILGVAWNVVNSGCGSRIDIPMSFI